ncbi:MAG: DUF2058 domain-containing protein [Xanthomonadales bacterium]|nr:DUF2058 domain-containing protein [Xanthomonadales bacterium]
MRNPLQDQLLKAGLVKKGQVDRVAREQAKQRHARAPAEPVAAPEDARRSKAEHDRALEAARKAEAMAREKIAQARQIIQQQRVRHEGESPYRFSVDGMIRTLLIDDSLRPRLASGALAIVRDGETCAVIPQAAAAKLRERAPELILLDHGGSGAAPAAADDEADCYRRFPVPDDLVW